MAKKINNEDFINLVLEALEPIASITYKTIDDTIATIYKEEIIFGLIIGSNLYLRSKANDIEIYQESYEFQGTKYCKVQLQQPFDKDTLLQAATKAFWVACGKS